MAQARVSIIENMAVFPPGVVKCLERTFYGVRTALDRPPGGGGDRRILVGPRTPEIYGRHGEVINLGKVDNEGLSYMYGLRMPLPYPTPRRDARGGNQL